MDLTKVNTMIRQIGAWNILAISGGRKAALNETTLVLPISNGYKVEVELDEGRDLYNVRRVFVRAGKRSVKGEMLGVYCDLLGEAAYQASCFRDGKFGD